MISAKPSPRFARWFSGQVVKQMKSHFSQLRLSGLVHIDEALAKGPVVVGCNHTAFWDAMMLIWFTFHIREFDGRCLMDAKNMRKLPFLRMVNAYGVELDDKNDRALGIDYAVKHLESPFYEKTPLLWIYPQGAERPLFERPLGYRPGAALIAKRSGAQLLPAVVHYLHGREPKPIATLAFAKAIDPEGLDSAMLTKRLEDAASELLAKAEMSQIDHEGFSEIWYRAKPAKLSRIMAWLLSTGSGLVQRRALQQKPPSPPLNGSSADGV